MSKISITLLFFFFIVCDAKADKVEDDFFERSIRPVLLERCIECHGSAVQKSGLRLDSRKAVIEGGKNGAVVIPGNPNASKLITSIKHEGQLKMPRDKKLSDIEIKAFEKWVTLGLPWPDSIKITLKNPKSETEHWSYLPVKKAVPPINEMSHPIDSFIHQKLNKRLIKQSATADKRTLIRRLSIDLIGLPPSISEISAFENDPSSDAYEKVVDRLLASPRYGERWARHWLDIARYADNKGYVFFEDKNYPWAWTYREYVINSLNNDLPYNQFIIEQIAADQIETKDKKSLAALGFLTVGGHFMGNTHDMIDDRIDVMTRGLMGLTVSCARCHDHKFDPIPAADYYSLYGIMRSSFEPITPPLYDTEPSTEEYKKFALELKTKEKKLLDFVQAKHRDLVTQSRSRVADYLLAAYQAGNQPPADDFMLLADKGDLNPAMIARWRAFLERMKIQKDPTWALWHRYSSLNPSSFSQSALEVRNLLSDNPNVLQAFEVPPKSMKQVADTYGKLLGETEKAWLSSGGKIPLQDKNAEMIRSALYGPNSPADAPLALDWGFLDLFPDRTTQGEYKALIKDLETHLVKGPPRSMVLLDSNELYEPNIFIRGQPNRIGDKVPRQFLKVLDSNRQSFLKGSGRLELAKSIASNTNPLTSRVFVNQVWAHHFGNGLVGTLGDFGVRGDLPTHPELLDWLAINFMENNWSIKKLHKVIVTSNTYKQSSNDREDCLKVDPENKLLWKQNRRRLDFESLHDSVLSVSGNLDLKVGGPSVSFFTGKNRRAVYGYIDRLDFPSLLATFDIPNPASSSVERTSTTVAPQALYLMNGPFVREAAKKVLNLNTIKEIKSADQKADAIMLAVLGRKPTAKEKLQMINFVMGHNENEIWLDLTHGLFLTNEFAFVD
ncbi:MAG: PSD1 and planctomycete cytochrome C domain-containing protein [Planctomycetota bacterium]